MIARIMDASFEGHIDYEVDFLKEVVDFLEHASGRWVESPDGGGDILLDMPYAFVYNVDMGVEDFTKVSDPYPDWIIEHDMVGNYETRTA